MIYYPQSKILPSQFTSGKDFLVKSTRLSYIGYYFELSNNTFFSGKSPSENNSQELIKNDQKNSNDSNALPNPYYVNPTDSDYKLGFITRYFIKRRNGDYTTIREISKQYWDNFSNDLYINLKINWRISGNKNDVISTNQSLVKLKEVVIPGISLYFNDYSQFLK